MVAEDQAQATVELAVVAPVMVVLALIVYNLMVFADATARFDRVAPDIVLIHGSAPAGEDGDGVSQDACGQVAARLEEALEGYDVEVEVTRSGAGPGEGGVLTLVGSPVTYRCTMRYRPWPSGFSLAGVDLGAPAVLEHERSVVIDPWKSGVVA